MHYQHAYHAGNFADVFKHVLLCGLLAALGRKDKPWCFFDTHAGAGDYDLAGEGATRTGEWRDGIGRLADVAGAPEMVVDFLRIALAAPGRYPGSPLFACDLARPGDRLVLCEKVPAVAEQLKRALRGDARAAVHLRDGYEAASLLPPAEKRGLVLIDPPFERVDEFEAVGDFLEQALARFAGGVYTAWYPLKNRRMPPGAPGRPARSARLRQAGPRRGTGHRRAGGRPDARLWPAGGEPALRLRAGGAGGAGLVGAAACAGAARRLYDGAWLRISGAEMADTGKAFNVAAHAAAMRAQGYTIIPEVLSPAEIAALRAGLAHYLGSYAGRNNFEGYKTERVYTLVARGRIFEDLACDARIMALCAEFLKPGFLLTASQAINIHPGETPQPIHSDDSFYTVPRPRPAISLSTIVAVDAFTAANGGTEIIPGSHNWSDAQVTGMFDGHDADAPVNPALERQLVPTVMPAGACVVFLGTLLHRGGANRSAAPRLAFSNQYCEPWARTQENFFLGVPPELARAMPPQVQQLLGYSIWPPFMGHVTASHPLKALRENHLNAVRAGRAEGD